MTERVYFSEVAAPDSWDMGEWIQLSVIDRFYVEFGPTATWHWGLKPMPESKMDQLDELLKYHYIPGLAREMHRESVLLFEDTKKAMNRQVYVTAGSIAPPRKKRWWHRWRR